MLIVAVGTNRNAANFYILCISKKNKGHIENHTEKKQIFKYLCLLPNQLIMAKLNNGLNKNNLINS